MAKQSTSGTGRSAARRRSKGLWTAAIFGLVVVGVLAAFAVRGRLTGGPRRADAGDLPARDITDLSLGGASGPEGQVVRAGAVNIQLEDPENPARLKGELHAVELEPQENHRYLVKQPEAWLYLKNGWMLYIRSDSGSFYIPDQQQQPEKGVLQGAVRCEGYAPRADGTRLSKRSLDRAVEKPGVVATMESLTFDATLGTLSTDGRVEMTSDQVDFAGTGLKLVVNQVREQLNALDVARGEYLKYRQGARGAAGLPSPRRAAPPTGEAPKGNDTGEARAPKAADPASAISKDPAPEPVETLYAAEFQQGVVVSEGARSARADQLELWARLIDNALPEGAIVDVPVGPEESPPEPAGGAREGRPASVAGENAAKPASGVGALTKSAGELTLTWTGPLRIRPLDAAPAELKQDHVYLRMTAEQTGLVNLSDPSREMSGRCAGLEYGATSRRLVLSGPGPSSVVLGLKDYEAEAVRIEADLGLGTGKIPGPGVGRDKLSGQRISWAEQGDFDFQIDRDAKTGAERLVGLKTALLRGKTAMAADDATVSADSMRAEFATASGAETSLERVHLSGNVGAEVGGGKSLTCDHGEMAFKPGRDAKEPDPTSFTAQGNVVARDGPSVAMADSLHAELERAEDGDVVVTRADLKGNARFVQDDGVRPRIEAEAAELNADPVKRVVDLIAEEGATARVVRGGSVLTGRSIRLDGMANLAWVVGPGTFDNGPDRRSPESPTVRASWTKEMKFDDTAGTLSAAGDVIADIAADPLSLDKIRSERVLIEMTPGREPSEADEAIAETTPTDTVGLDPSGGRKLIRARADGAVREVEGGGNASVESWRFAADKAAPGGRRPDRVLYLEGPVLLASEAEQTLDVTGEGRLLVVDRRYFDGSSGAPARPEESGLSASIGRGSVGGSMFTWQGSMRLDRSEGSVHFVERVRLNHRPQRDASLLELECEDLTAQIVERAGGDDAAPEQIDGELRSADAKGAVWARSAARELIADHLSYDARTGKAQARASEGNRVTVFDRARATTVTAASIMWDLTGDTIEVIDPGAVTAPR